MDGTAFTFAFILSFLIFGGPAVVLTADYGARILAVFIAAVICIGAGLAVISGALEQSAASGFAGAAAASLLVAVASAAVLASMHFLGDR